jgi:hypothetical protein
MAGDSHSDCLLACTEVDGTTNQTFAALEGQMLFCRPDTQHLTQLRTDNLHGQAVDVDGPTMLVRIGQVAEIVWGQRFTVRKSCVPRQ